MNKKNILAMTSILCVGLFIGSLSEARSLDLVRDASGRVVQFDYDNLPPEIESCSSDMFVKLNVRSSTLDKACFKRSDSAYKQCIVELTNKLDRTNFQDETVAKVSDACLAVSRAATSAEVDLFVNCGGIIGEFIGPNHYTTIGNHCIRARNYNYPLCVVNLAANGANKGKLFEEVCNGEAAIPVSTCVRDQKLQHNIDGLALAKICRETYDPFYILQEAQRKADEERQRIEAEKIKTVNEQKQQHEELLKSQNDLKRSQEKAQAQLEALEKMYGGHDEKTNGEQGEKSTHKSTHKTQDSENKKTQKATAKVNEKESKKTTGGAKKKAETQAGTESESQADKQGENKNTPQPEKTEGTSSSGNGSDGVILDLPNF